jgi:hypothetical protein
MLRVPDRQDNVTIAFPLRYGASGNRTVPLASLADTSQPTAAELAEMHDLDARISGKARPKGADLARFEALRLRVIRAPLLRQKLAQLAQRNAMAA